MRALSCVLAVVLIITMAGVIHAEPATRPATLPAGSAVPFGVIVSVSDTELVLKSKRSKAIETYKVTEKTEVLLAGKKATLVDLAPGTLVELRVDGDVVTRVLAEHPRGRSTRPATQPHENRN